MRRTITIKIEEAGRDLGKSFVLTEMDAERAESWAIRALLALTNAGATLPDTASQLGMAGFAAAGVEALGKLSFDVAKPLLDEMMTCVKYLPPAGPPAMDLLRGDACQIEEVSTRLKLRMAVLQLHVDFSTAGAPQN